MWLATTTDDDDTMDLVTVGAELRDVHGINASYARLYRACLDGVIPGIRIRGRWRLPRTDMPRAAAALRGPRRATDRDERSGRFIPDAA